MSSGPRPPPDGRNPRPRPGEPGLRLHADVASSRCLTAKVAVDLTSAEADGKRLDEAQRPVKSHVADEGHARSGVARVERRSLRKAADGDDGTRPFRVARRSPSSANTSLGVRRISMTWLSCAIEPRYRDMSHIGSQSSPETTSETPLAKLPLLE